MNQSDPNNQSNRQNDIKESSDSLYLNQLEYHPEDGQNWMNYLLQHFRVVILFIVALFAFGIFGYSQLPLESNPEVEIPFGIVTVGLPGASPSDVEELIVKKLEDDVVNIEGVKTVSATAGNSFASINVEFEAGEDLGDAIRRLRDAIDGATGDLPEEANDPVVSEVSFSNQPVWTFVVSGPFDNFSIRDIAETIEAELETLSGASAVNISGGDISEIRISLLPSRLEQYGLTVQDIQNAINSANFTLPLGTIDISDFEYSIRAENDFNTVSELRNIPVSNQGDQIIRLGNVANVVERAEDRDVINRFSVTGSEPVNAVTVNVVKKTGASIIDLIDSGKQRIEEMRGNQIPQNVEISTIIDESDFIRDDFNSLTRDGAITVVLVFIVLLLFVGLKEAFVAGASIPMVFAATFGFMYLSDITLNFLSLFSLILALGLIVDDAIVIVQAVKQYLRTGKFTPEEAVLLVFKDFKTLILTTSLATIFAFFPLLLATGIIGQFIRSIPITVSLAFISSTAIAIFINHPMAAALERLRPTRNHFKIAIAILFGLLAFSIYLLIQSFNLVNILLLALCIFLIFSAYVWYYSSLKKTLQNNEQLILEETADPAKMRLRINQKYLSEEAQNSLWNRLTSGIVKLDSLLPTYKKFLNSILESRAKTIITLVVTALVFFGSVAMPATGIVRSEFLPPSDAEQLFINIEGPPGLITSETQKVVDQVTEILLDEPNIRTFSVVTGGSGVDTGGSPGGGGASSAGLTNRAQFAINLFPEDERPEPIKSYRYAPQLRQKISSIKGADIEVAEISGGPPAGADFEARLLGDDLLELERLVNQYQDLLDQIPGTVNESTSLTLSPGEFTFRLLPDRLQTTGITAPQVSSTLRTALNKTEVTTILRNDEEISITLDFTADTITSIDDLKSLKLVNNRGQVYQISEIADVQLGSSLTSISRRDQKRVVTLSAAVESPALPGEVLEQFRQILEENPLPPGYEFEFGGVNETNEESILSILRAMIVAFILIISILVLQFDSFRKASLVLATIPLAITGVFYGFAATGFTLSFPALIGILALFGIVVKNAIILIDKINLNLRVGITFQESIIDACSSRLEAIFLTTISTIIGMIPITLNNETWEGLGAALIFGLSTSTVLTLIVIPTLYNIFFAQWAKKQDKLRQLSAKAGQNP